jgi:hypothetical protein
LFCKKLRLALSSSLIAKVLADGGLTNNIQNLFNAFILIPFRDAVLTKPFAGQTARVVYYAASYIILALLAIAANS